MKPIHLTCLILLAALILAGCNSSASTIVGTYTNGKITLEEAVTEFQSLPHDEQIKRTQEDELSRIIRKVALDKILYDLALEEKLDESKEFLERLEEKKKKTAYELFRKKNVTDKVTITDADYQPYRKSYELYQIVKRNDILDEAKLAAIKNKLKNLSASIRDLESFKKAAKDYSDDITAQAEGYVGFIRQGVMEEEIDQALSRLKPGTVSGVIESSAGYHLLFVKEIKQLDMNELISDRELYETIVRNKEEKLENDWYDRLLKSHGLKINSTLIKSSKADDVIISYKTRSITKKEIDETVYNLRQQGAFPEPTDEELFSMLKNMGLNLVLEDLIHSAVTSPDKEFSNKIENEKRFILKNLYIDRHIQVKQVSDEDIRLFYQENLKTLFTFKLDSGVVYTQKLDEVKKFITQKLEPKMLQDARYDLYRKLVQDNGFKVEEKQLPAFKKEITRLMKGSR